MMEYMNVLRKGERTPHRDEVVPMISLVSPFAPHLAEELWEQTGGAAKSASVFDAGWPEFDAALAAEDSIELVVQVNGRVRAKIRVARDIDQVAAVEAAMSDATVARFASGAPKKIIFVPGRLLNIVV
jgi:leucyl-tRNA synthetase